MLGRRSPTLGAGRLLCLDGPGGSGKTTLADAVAALSPASTRVVHLDDLYDGWSGLATVADQLAPLLRPLAAGRPGRYRRYDWHARAFAETVVVDPVPLLVLEGVGAGSATTADLATVLVWVEAPQPLRLDRGVARDGEQLRAQWHAWQRDEQAHFAADRTRERADLVVDGTGAHPVVDPRDEGPPDLG